MCGGGAYRDKSRIYDHLFNALQYKVGGTSTNMCTMRASQVERGIDARTRCTINGNRGYERANTYLERDSPGHRRCCSRGCQPPYTYPPF